MRPRAAVFVFHDVVPAARLGEVPVEHRPYSLASEELRAFLLAASTSARRAVPAGDVREELAGLFYSLTFDDGHASDPPRSVPRVAATRGMPIEAFAAIVEAEPRALWRLQMIEAAKDTVKACVGRRGWAALRRPLIRLRYSQELP